MIAVIIVMKLLHVQVIDTKMAFKDEHSEVDRLKLIKKGGVEHICNEPESPRDGPMIDLSPT